MGNNQTKENTSMKDWQKVDTDNGIEIFKNNKTNQLAQKRIVTLDGEIDVKKQVKVYKMRENNNDALVRAFGSQELTKKAESFVSCAGGNKIFVFTEKMPHRLSQLPQLTFPQSLLFLRQSLRAYQRLFKQYGPVQVTKQLIGLNYLGQVKSWLNSNWALNHRNHEYGNLRSKKLSQLTRQQYLAYREQYLDEPQMIKSIISVIEKKCEEGVFPQAFKEEVISQSGSFKKLLLYLKDFVDYNHIYVPEKLNYDELVNSNYHVRLDQQLNFANGKKLDEQVVNGNKQVLVVNGQQQQVGQQQQNGFINLGFGGQQPSGQISLSNQQQQAQIQSNRSIGYQTTQPSSVIQNFSQTRIPQPIKQSPVSSDMGQVTFSQTTRNYNQQQDGQTSQQPTSTYQWSTLNQNMYTPSFQKVQQSPQIGSYASGGSYGLNGITVGQETVVKNNYSVQPPAVETSYQGGNYSTSFGGVNAGGFQANNNVSNGDYSYSKYTGNTFGTILQQAKPSTGSYGLSNNTYNYSSSYSSSTPGSNYAIGGIDSNKNIQNNPSSLGYANLDNLSTGNNISSNKWNFSGPTTTTYVSETYNYSTSKPVESTYTTTTQRVPAFSFDGRQDFNSKFGTGYTGTGYSNTLTKYESESTNPSAGFNVQGKYSQAFNTLLNPTTRTQTFEQITSTQPITQNGETTYKTTTTETVVTTTQQQKLKSSNISGSNVSGRNVVSEQQTHTPKNINPLEAFTNMVERVSNDVSESVLKIE